MKNRKIERTPFQALAEERVVNHLGYDIDFTEAGEFIQVLVRLVQEYLKKLHG